MQAVCATQQPSPLMYLLKWMAIFGGVVGLVIPQDLAQSVEKHGANQVKPTPRESLPCEACSTQGTGPVD